MWRGLGVTTGIPNLYRVKIHKFSSEIFVFHSKINKFIIVKLFARNCILKK
jgi:hypothetical protein